jgi:hypothetical protein
MRYDERYAPAVIEELPIIADNTMLILILIGVGGLMGLGIIYILIKSIFNFIKKLIEEQRSKPKTKKTKPKKEISEFKIPEFPRGKRELFVPPPVVEDTVSNQFSEDPMHRLDYNQNSFRQVTKQMEEEEWSYYSVEEEDL